MAAKPTDEVSSRSANDIAYLPRRFAATLISQHSYSASLRGKFALQTLPRQLLPGRSLAVDRHSSKIPTNSSRSDARLSLSLPQGEALPLTDIHRECRQIRWRFLRVVEGADPYYVVTTKTLPARVILEWRTAALQILRYARE